MPNSSNQLSHSFLTEFLQKQPSAVVGKGASLSCIEDAEESLGVKFPRAFQTYLLTFGYLELRSAEWYGLGAGVPSHLDLVRNTIDERTKFEPHIPQQLIPFSANGCGDHYCIKIKKTADDPPVVFWNHELGEDQVPVELAESFSSWLLHHTDEWS